MGKWVTIKGKRYYRVTTAGVALHLTKSEVDRAGLRTLRLYELTKKPKKKRKKR